MSRKRRRWLWQNVPGQTTNLRGPNRALSLDEQLEVQRIMQQARIDRRRTKTAVVLAARYGVSNRTIYRYAETIAVPPGLENLTMRIDMRIYDNGSMRLHVDHPSNEPAVELAMGGAILSMVREKFREVGLEPPVIGPIKWNDDPEPPT